MKIFVFIFTFSLAFASTHEEEMELLKNQLYVTEEAEQVAQVVDEVSTQAAAPTPESEQDFLKRRKEILDSLNSKRETEIIDLEKLYFSDTSEKK